MALVTSGTSCWSWAMSPAAAAVMKRRSTSLTPGPVVTSPARCALSCAAARLEAVPYTHLTLPTVLLVSIPAVSGARIT